MTTDTTTPHASAFRAGDPTDVTNIWLDADRTVAILGLTTYPCYMPDCPSSERAKMHSTLGVTVHLTRAGLEQLHRQTAEALAQWPAEDAR